VSRAREAITRVLAGNSDWSPEQIRQVTDELMPVVRETVAHGFDTAAARIAERPDVDPVVRLHRWAGEARAAS
jgi:hypothetical protein